MMTRMRDMASKRETVDRAGVITRSYQIGNKVLETFSQMLGNNNLLIRGSLDSYQTNTTVTVDVPLSMMHMPRLLVVLVLVMVYMTMCLYRSREEEEN